MGWLWVDVVSLLEVISRDRDVVGKYRLKLPVEYICFGFWVRVELSMFLKACNCLVVFLLVFDEG